MGKGRRVRAARVAADSSASVVDRWVQPPTAVNPAPSADWSRSTRMGQPAAPSTSRPRRSRSCDRLRAVADERAEVRLRLAELDRAVVDQVRRERAAGATWADVGRVLGMSRQAARQRFASCQSAIAGRATG